MASIDNGAWDGGQAMSDATNSDDPAAAYAAICAGRRDGDPALQSTWALPHHQHPGDPANADGVRNALSRLPQTQGLTNAEAAQRHLEAHMSDISPDATRSDGEDIVTFEFTGSDVVVRDLAKREIEARLVPWDVEIETSIGIESFAPGSFAKVDPSKVVLLLGHSGDPGGRGTSVEERTDGPYMVLRASKTAKGDEILTLAADGVTPHVSVGYRADKTKGEVTYRNGRRHTRITEVALDHVATTWRPAYSSADIVAVREAEPIQTEQEITPVPETEATPTAAPTQPAANAPAPFFDPVAVASPAMAEMRSVLNSQEHILDRLEKIETRSRQDFIIPTQTNEANAIARTENRTGEWVGTALKILTGERVSDMQLRDLSDLIVSDNIGIVPNAVLQNELVGIIDPARPFLETTRQLALPDSGMSLVVPVIQTRPTVGIQSPEKDDIVSTTTSITSETFNAVTVAGGGDISIQLLKRSSPAYLDLYLRLLAEAYATDADSLAVATLLDSGVTPGTGYIDPEDLTIGEAWTNAVSVSRLLRPDHIWLSTQAIQAFIDAKANTTNEPLYSNLAADITVANGARGLISGLTPVYVPALDGSGADVLIGPSRGFAWAEDGTFTLQVDVPSKAGRDVAIVGILWFAPLYPSAFTSYRLAS